jgi:hypothetical protein
MATALVEHHGGEVPADMDALVKLPGGGTQTANVILGNAFGRNDGFVVDTHVTRLSNRLGLATGTDAVKLEQALIAPSFRKQHWTMLSHLPHRACRQVATRARRAAETAFLLTFARPRSSNFTTSANSICFRLSAAACSGQPDCCGAEGSLKNDHQMNVTTRSALVALALAAACAGNPDPETEPEMVAGDAPCASHRHWEQCSPAIVRSSAPRGGQARHRGRPPRDSRRRTWAPR